MAPNLCAPVILGLPFLTVNNIVTDHTARTCIDKVQSYDLLNPKPRTLPKPKPHHCLCAQLQQMCLDHKLMIDELKFVLQSQLHLLNFDYVKPVDVAAAISAHIEVLTHVVYLMHMRTC